jgi:hypothetical protein
MGNRFLISRINHHGRIKAMVTACLHRAPRSAFSRGADGTVDCFAVAARRASDARV